jgi:polar amino acid transport system substrate-binding protein
MLIALVASWTLTANAADLRLAANNWPPYVGDALPAKGLAIDIVTAALKRAGYETSITIDSWQRTLEGADLGVYDVIAAAWRTPERAARYTFSKPYLANEIVFIKQKDRSIRYNGPADLDGLLIGTVQDYAYGPSFDDATNFRRLIQQHVIQNLSSLVQGQIDLTLGDRRVIMHELKTYMPDSIHGLEFLPVAVSSRGLHIAVSKQNADHEKIARDFDRAISGMTTDGSLQKIIERHR